MRYDWYLYINIACIILGIALYIHVKLLVKKMSKDPNDDAENRVLYNEKHIKIKLLTICGLQLLMAGVGLVRLIIKFF